METTSFRYGKHIGALTVLCLVGFVGVRLYQADQIEQRAAVVGWELNVPIVGLDVFDQQVADSERLRQTAEVIERKYDVVLPHPYNDYWLEASGKWLRELSRSGIDFSTVDLSGVNMYTWISIRPLLTFRNIPPGTFRMGCTDEQGIDCHDWEKPVHSVTLSKEFYMMESEVTQALYETVMGHNPSRHVDANQPVEQVTWYDAVKFANRLSEIEGLTPCYTINGESVEWSDTQCKGWRLPTEAEWEYAARGRQQNTYAGSDRLEDVGWYYGNSNSQSQDVCVKYRNGFGLCDMSGNVWEWTWDGYGEYNVESQTDPVGPSTASRRVLRGGSWRHYERNSRVSIRYYIAPQYGDPSWGFRLVRLA